MLHLEKHSLAPLALVKFQTVVEQQAMYEHVILMVCFNGYSFTLFTSLHLLYFNVANLKLK